MVLSSVLCETVVMTEFADNRPYEEIITNNKLIVDKYEEATKSITSSRRTKNLTYLRKKRLRRNQKKKEEFGNLNKKERRTRIREKISVKLKLEVEALKVDLEDSRKKLKKERMLSNYCWKKWKDESTFSKHRNM